jgi:hypothetical protein
MVELFILICQILIGFLEIPHENRAGEYSGSSKAKRVAPTGQSFYGV